MLRDEVVERSKGQGLICCGLLWWLLNSLWFYYIRDTWNFFFFVDFWFYSFYLFEKLFSPLTSLQMCKMITPAYTLCHVSVILFNTTWQFGISCIYVIRAKGKKCEVSRRWQEYYKSYLYHETRAILRDKFLVLNDLH